jgi:hypothetical protein
MVTLYVWYSHHINLLPTSRCVSISIHQMTDAFQILFVRWIVLNFRVDFLVHVHWLVFISISIPVVSNILDYHSWKSYIYTARNVFLFLFSFNGWVCICLFRFLLLGWWVTVTFPLVGYIDGKLLTACVSYVLFSRSVCSCTVCRKLCAAVRRFKYSTRGSVLEIFHREWKDVLSSKCGIYNFAALWIFMLFFVNRNGFLGFFNVVHLALNPCNVTGSFLIGHSTTVLVWRLHSSGK